MKLIYMSLGGGVQSGTMAEMIAEKELPCPDVVIFADTGNEPQYVYDYVEYLTSRLSAVGVPVETVSNGDLVTDLLSAKKRFAAIPAHTKINGKHRLLRRQCTSEYKIVPIEKHVRQRLLKKNLAKKTKNDAIRVKRGVSVECWLGISLDEVQRMKRNKTPWIQNRWPLIEKRMTRHDCQLWLEQRGLPVPRKSSCRICPFHDDNYWRDMRDMRDVSGDWEHVIKIDDMLRNGTSRFQATAKGELYLHKSCVPLADVDLRTPEERGQLSFDVCDDGYCFI